MWEPNGNHRVQIRYGGTASVPPGTTLHNMAHCAGLKTPKITNITPTTSTHAPQGSLPSNRQQKPPHLVPPKVWGDSSDDSEPPRNVATLSERRVEDIVKMFGTTTDVKTTTKPGRWPATRKTAGNATRILEEEDDLGTTQGVPKLLIVNLIFKTIVTIMTRVMLCLVILEDNHQLLLCQHRVLICMNLFRMMCLRYYLPVPPLQEKMSRKSKL